MAFSADVDCNDYTQLLDYDRHNNSLTKLRDKKEKSLNDEKNLFKVRLCVSQADAPLTDVYRSNKNSRSRQMNMITSTQL